MNGDNVTGLADLRSASPCAMLEIAQRVPRAPSARSRPATTGRDRLRYLPVLLARHRSKLLSELTPEGQTSRYNRPAKAELLLQPPPHQQFTARSCSAAYCSEDGAARPGAVQKTGHFPFHWFGLEIRSQQLGSGRFHYWLPEGQVTSLRPSLHRRRGRRARHW